LRVRVREGIRCRQHRPGRRFAAGGQFQHRFGGFGGQMIGEREQAIFISLLHIRQPFDRNAVGQQFLVGAVRQRQPGCS
jgi:hypothetical protein